VSDDAALRAVVRGRVQGVGFRDYVKTRARMLRLVGNVRNMEDGRSVEVIAEGPRDLLEQLVRQLHDGPRMSRVDAVDVEWREPTGRFGDFRTGF
jgi:acylphosphatase